MSLAFNFLCKSASFVQARSSWRLTINGVISLELELTTSKFKILVYQNPEFKILEVQNLEFQNLEFRILAVQNLEFRILET